MGLRINPERAKWDTTYEKTRGDYKYTEETNGYGARRTHIENTKTGSSKSMSYDKEGNAYALEYSQKRGNYTKTDCAALNSNNHWELSHSSITDGVNKKTICYKHRSYHYSYNNGEKNIVLTRYRDGLALDSYNNKATGVSSEGLNFKLTEGLGKLKDAKLTTKERKFVLPLVEKELAKWIEILHRIKV